MCVCSSLRGGIARGAGYVFRDIWVDFGETERVRGEDTGKAQFPIVIFE